MKIEIARIPPEGLPLEGEEPASILGLEDAPGVRFKDGIRYDLMATMAGDELVVSGSLEMDAEFVCSRCAEFAVGRVEEPAFMVVEPIKDRTEVVDLTGEIREATILAFPNYPLCSRECKGLCPRCGANLNKKRCRCGKSADVRWSALDDLSIK